MLSRIGAPGCSDRAALELAALAFTEAAPDAEALVVLQRVLEAFAADVAGGADALGIARRAALFREEGFRVWEQSASVCQESAVSSSDSGRRTPGTPRLTGSTNQFSGTSER